MNMLKCTLVSLALIFTFSLFAVEGTYDLERVIDEEQAARWGGGGGRGGGEDMSVTLTLVKAEDGTYSGTLEMPGWDGGINEMDLEDLSVDDKKLTFKTTLSWEGRDGMPGGSMETNYEGSVEDGKLSLTSTADMMGREITQEWTGTLQEAEEDSEEEATEAAEAPSDEA
ncbi:MAG: hypothetical protein F4039_04230 [Gammaproteobacteria bacterium]|nr:hypothetical protein [Gammaproteobacteria bacterium]MYF53489.1 hypothetical protein [Gammaproteobacteria bacterium]MYK43279.1 hypothetical protein [Gammaproteobacteria bacterium]